MIVVVKRVQNFSELNFDKLNMSAYDGAGS